MNLTNKPSTLEDIKAVEAKNKNLTDSEVKRIALKILIESENNPKVSIDDYIFKYTAQYSGDYNEIASKIKAEIAKLQGSTREKSTDFIQ